MIGNWYSDDITVSKDRPIESSQFVKRRLGCGRGKVLENDNTASFKILRL